MSGVEDLHPHGRVMSPRGESILTDGPSISEYTCIGGPSPVSDPTVDEDLDDPGYIEFDPLAGCCYTPKPGAPCKRTTLLQNDRSMSTSRPPHGVSFIFVQGKESACIVARDLGKGKKNHDLRLDFIGWSAIGLKRCSILDDGQPADMYTFTVVSVLLNPDDLNYKKESKPDSSHKDSSFRRVNEQAANNFLKQKLDNYTYEETIQTTIYALQCLYQENIKADEIEVCTGQGDCFGEFLTREEIELHLAVINNATSSTSLDHVGS